MILCAGTSKRFGSDKMLASLSGLPLLAHTIARVRPQVSNLAINGEGGAYGKFELPVIPDTAPGKLGPLAGILTALEWAVGQGVMRVFTVSGDAPFVPKNWVKMMSLTHEKQIALPIVGSQSHQVCGLWPVELVPELRAFIQEGRSYKVRDFLKGKTVELVEFPKQRGIDPFFNVNTQDDLQMAEQILATRN